MDDKKRFLKRAMNHSYLSDDLETIAQADGKEIEDYSLSDLVDEAFYCLSLYSEIGHLNNPDEYDIDDSEYKTLKKEKSQLARLCRDFKKYKTDNKWGASSK